MIDYRKRRKRVFLILFFVFLFSIFSVSSYVFSSTKLEMKIEYLEDVWDLSTEESFSKEWFSKGSEIKFTVNLSEYFYQVDFEEGDIEQPFEVNAKYINRQVDDISITRVLDEEGEFSGIYEVQIDLSDFETLKDHFLYITISILEGNSWEIPEKEGDIDFFIFRDTTKPTINLSGIDDGYIFYSDNETKKPILNIEVKDRYLDYDNVFISVNGEKEPLEVDQKTNQAKVEFTEDGKYEVYVKAADLAGNTAISDEITFYIHYEEPKIKVSIDGEEDISGRYYNEELLIDIEIQNSLPDYQVEVFIEKDDKLNKIIEYQRKNFAIDLSENGKYNISFYITDTHNDGEYTHEFNNFISLTIDQTDPTISIFEIEDGEKKIIEQELSFSKDILVEIVEENLNEEQTKVIVYKDDEEFFLDDDFQKDSENPNLYIWSYLFEEDGNYSLEVNAKDKAKNNSSQAVTFSVDQTPPEIEIDGIKNGVHYNDIRTVDISITDDHLDQENITLEIEVLNEQGEFEEYPIDEQLEFPDDETSIIQIPFEEEGTYKIYIHAFDLIKNETEIEKTFTIDQTKPELFIENINNGEFNNDSKEVKISVVEENYMTNEVNFVVTRNGEDITDIVEDGHEEWWREGKESELIYTFTEDGFYTIYLSAIDRAGNEADDLEKTFTIDQTNPKIHITGIEDGKYYNYPVEAEFSVRDVNLDVQEIIVLRNGVEYDVGDFVIEEGEDFEDSIALLRHEFLEEGNYTLTISAVDQAGNEAFEVLEFTIDLTKPDLTVINQIPSYVKAEYIHEKGVNQLVSIHVEEENINQMNVNVLYETPEGKKENINQENLGQWVSEDHINYSFIFNEEVFYKDGIYEVNIEVKDRADNQAKDHFTFTIDNIKPEITLSKVDRYNRFPIDQHITVKEFNYDTNNVDIEIYKQNSKEQFIPYHHKDFPRWKNLGEITKHSYPFKEDGTYKIIANAKDKAGNEAETKANIFTIDTIAPKLSIKGIDITKDIKHYNSNKRIYFSVEDVNISKSRTKLDIRKRNETTGKMEPFSIGKDFTFTDRKATLNYLFQEEGLYSIKLDATDKAGNRAEPIEVSFVIDKTAPVLSIDGINHNKYYDTNRKVDITIDEQNYKTNHISFSVKRNGRDITKIVEQSSGPGWKNSRKHSQLTYMFSEDGTYEINLQAIDAAGNRARSERKIFTIDKVKPKIDVSGVENGEYYNEDRLVNMTITDVNLDVNDIRITRNGHPYDVGQFSIQHHQFSNSIASLKHNFTLEGDYVIFIEAIDKAGNRSTKRVEFTIDKTPPVITAIMKEDGTEIKDGSYINRIFTPEFRLDHPEDEIVSITLNNGPNIVGKVPIASDEMEYHYQVLARDKAGNETTLNLRFIVDTTSPQLNISGILEGYFNRDLSPNVTYYDKNLDEKNTFVTLNGKPFENGMTLQEEGDYVLRAVIADLAGNVTKRTIFFTIDKTAPVIRFEENISNQFFNDIVLPKILIEDMSDYDIIAITLNGEPYTLGDPIEEEGKHVLYFEVKDKAGNIRQLTVEFVIDLTPPIIIFEGVEDNGKYYEGVDLYISLDNPEDEITSITLNGEVVEGHIFDRGGHRVVSISLEDLDKYEVAVEARDQAGNTTHEKISFEIADKSWFVKLYENKSVFYGIVIGLLLSITSIVALLFHTINRGEKLSKNRSRA